MLLVTQAALASGMSSLLRCAVAATCSQRDKRTCSQTWFVVGI